MLGLNINRKMSTEQLQKALSEAGEDYRFYIKSYQVLFRNHGNKNKQTKKALKLANHAEKRYKIAEVLLLNR